MKLHMKLPIGFVCAVLFLTVSVQPCYGSMAGTPPPPPTLDELSRQFKHVFIGEVVSKEIAETETHYTFNVSEWLLNPLNTSQVQWTEGGGSVIMVIPSTTLYVGIDYLVYFDDYNGTQIGKDRRFLVLNGIDDHEMTAFRGYLNYPNSVVLAIVPPPVSNKFIELARQAAREAAKREAAREAARKVTITDYPAPDSPNMTELARRAAGSGGVVASTDLSNHADAVNDTEIQLDLRPHTLLVSWVILMLILKKLLKR